MTVMKQNVTIIHDKTCVGSESNSDVIFCGTFLSILNL